MQASHTNTLKQATTLAQGSTLTCSNGTYHAHLRDDGNLNVYSSHVFLKANSIFSSNSSGKGHGPYHLCMQEDGNLVIYDKSNTVTWATDTYQKGQGPYRLEMQTDGNLVVYGGSQPTWASNTNR